MLAILKSGDVDILLDQSSERGGIGISAQKNPKIYFISIISWICARSHDQLFTDLIEDEKERIRLCVERCAVCGIYIYNIFVMVGMSY